MICSKDNCTGCYACYNICPKQCISMEEDEYGYIYPTIDEESCVNCKACEKVCPSNVPIDDFKKPMKTYASWSNDEKDRVTSSSGGLSSVIATYVVENGGYVFGAVYEEGLNVRHIEVNNIEGLKRIKESKYTHSSIEDTFRNAKRLLNNNKDVLFVGTPCQIAGLLKYLGKTYDNLLTIDIICHGVPSNRMLQEYVRDTTSEKVDKVRFRSGTDNNFAITFLQNDKIVYKKHFRESEYYMGFMEGMIYRENCYKCTYARKERISDITLGDFWGIGEKIPFNHNVDKGVSVVLCNTDKGIAIVDKIKDRVFIEERTLEEAVFKNEQLNKPTRRHPKRNQFLDLYKNKSFNKSIRKCLRRGFIKFKVKKYLFIK
ncbi:Coenzyme F420 hydrogenase/dehydrogenase, beta subunit C-terminal domain [Clostridium sp. MSJ-8]|uniref:Coenzyme F420 hydrogenase/dehydrogenase, beta subunit C-terminal domain n=1 Tax=Clostridium sp. MSJ-8 TaxID=2841510 RepID=UPI001C0EDA95|nr:Coenzyme F420 hydrogenase/dehydrogenase, beta subunit C-terminal domain [Clostridium sp. MSJ-8]MBU5487103.1 Coenzyme F420 hydrogenase/dehydrogenase, beta subunit C-terminal domain [Clostridium sp. MSJ-8]